MCGRYSIYAIEQQLAAYGFRTPKNFKPRYNAAPSEQLPVITEDGTEYMRWGLIPSFSKAFSTTYSTINARSEGIEKSRLYGRLLKDHRCLIPANSFFEWVVTNTGKQPKLIKLKDRELFFFAGLWDHWYDAEKKEFRSFTILTCEPNPFMAKIHNRMPVILEEIELRSWLEEKEYIDFKQVLDPFKGKDLTAYPVSTLVNRPANDSEAVIEKLGS